MSRGGDSRNGLPGGFPAALFTALIVIVSFLDTMAQLPILGPYAVSFGTGAIFTGVILGSYSLVNMMGNLLAGPVIDAHDREITIMIGLVLAGVAVASYAAVINPWQLLLVRIIHGAGGGILIPAVFAWAGDQSRKGAVGRTMGHAGAAVALAAMLGPALGGVGGARFGPRAVFLSLGILLCVTALALGVRYGYSRIRRVAPRPAPDGLDRSALPGVLRDKHLGGTFRAIFSLTFAMGTLAYTMPLTMVRWGFSTGHTGLLFSVSSVAAIVLLLSPANRLPDRVGPTPVIRAGLLLVTVALVGLVFLRSLPLLVVVMSVYGMGFGAVFAATTTAVVSATGRNRRGTAFGVYYAFFSLGVFIGPIAAGAIEAAGAIPYWGAVAVIVLIQALPVPSRRSAETRSG